MARIEIQSTLEEAARLIGDLNTAGDRARLYNGFTVPYARLLKRKYMNSDGRWWTDRTGVTRTKVRVQRGNIKFPTQVVFQGLAHILDAGNQRFPGYDWVAQLVNENQQEGFAVGMRGLERAWAKFATKINKDTLKLKPKVVRPSGA